MAQCFVIQPFDNGKFDKRYADVFEPAIKAAKLQPYRVDKDPSVNDLIDGIKKGMNDSAAFLADITTDNPNVWYELGHAMSLGIPFCVCCSEERTAPFPFDVSHLSIIKYKVGSTSDFTELGERITERLKAVVTHEARLQNLRKSVVGLTQTQGLAPNEVAALTVLFEYQYDDEAGLPARSLHKDMGKAGFTKVAANLALTELLEKELIERTDYEGNEGRYSFYSLTKKGLGWLSANRDQLVMTDRREPEISSPISDEDIPF
jgi:hypothetical protein